jgi:hypothetical protein
VCIGRINHISAESAKYIIPLKFEFNYSQMMEVINSGRTGENFGAWVGEDIVIGEQLALHRRITIFRGLQAKRRQVSLVRSKSGGSA